MRKKDIIKLAPYALEKGFTADEAWKWLSVLEQGFDIGFIREDGVYPLRDEGFLFEVGNIAKDVKRKGVRSPLDSCKKISLRKSSGSNPTFQADIAFISQ